MKASKNISKANVSKKQKGNSEFSKMFVHHVFFWLKDPQNKAHTRKFKTELKKLVAVETIRYSHIGIPAKTNRKVIDSSYQFSLLTIFDNKKDHDIYQEHEIHLQFIDKCEDLWKKVLVYDSK